MVSIVEWLAQCRIDIVECPRAQVQVLSIFDECKN